MPVLASTPARPGRAVVAPRELEIRHADWWAAACLAALTSALYLSLMPWTTLWDRDEPRFAGAAVEMVRSGQYLYPTFNGEVRPQKPILIYWLMTLSVRTLGASELAVRCWGALGIALSALFTYCIGRRLWSPRAGIVAMIVLASSPLVMVEGLAATTDAILLAATTGAIAAFVWLLTSQPSGWHLAALTIALALAQLTKGPVGLVIPLAVMLGTLCVAGEAIARRQQVLRTVVGAAGASLAIFAAWAIPANLATGGLFLTEGIGRENVTRALWPIDGHGAPGLLLLPFYPLVIVLGFLPWTVCLPAALGNLFEARRSSKEAQALLVSWILVPVAIFTAAATKLPHYVLPIWPALALGVAATLERGDGGRLQDQRSVRIGRRFPAVLVTLGFAILLIAFVMVPVPAARAPIAVLGIVLLIAATPLRSVRDRAFGHVDVALLAVCCFSAQIVAAVWLLPALEVLKPVPRLAAAIRERSPASDPIVTYEVDEPSLVFYSDRAPLARLWSDAQVVAWSHQPGPGVLVTTRSAMSRIAGGLVAPGTPFPVREIAAASGISFVDGSRLELIALQKISNQIP